MGAQTDLANQRGQHARQKDAETAVATARAAAAKLVPQAAIRAVDDTLRDAGSNPGDLKPPLARCRSCAP